MRCVELLVASRVEDDGSAIREVLRRHGEETPPDAAELAELRIAAGRLMPVAYASAVAEAAGALNELLAECHAPRLSAHDGTQWHLHVDSSDNTGWAEWFLSSSSLALSVLLTEMQMPPLRVCEALRCGRPFLALSRGRERRFCSNACATRTRVAEYRSRS